MGSLSSSPGIPGQLFHFVPPSPPQGRPRLWTSGLDRCDDSLVSIAENQTLRVLDGRYVLERGVTDHGAGDGEVLATVHGPDGGARMRRDDAAGNAWVALWNGDAAHPPEATGMLAAVVSPLAAGNVPVWVAASFDGDIVLVPADQANAAFELLRRVGHRVID